MPRLAARYLGNWRQTMFSHIGLFWDLLKEGKSLANPAIWKNYDQLLNVFILLITGIGSVIAIKYPGFNIDSATAAQIAGGIIGLLTVKSHLVNAMTSDKVGIIPDLAAAKVSDSVTQAIKPQVEELPQMVQGFK